MYVYVYVVPAPSLQATISANPTSSSRCPQPCPQLYYWASPASNSPLPPVSPPAHIASNIVPSFPTGHTQPSNYLCPQGSVLQYFTYA